jgi:ribosomal protein L11 methyltransferase
LNFRLVLCNLTADLIIEVLPEIDRILMPHGIAIFSGILSEQREDICAALADAGLIIHEQLARGEWLALVAEKHVV